jgi:hypothetical protein
MNLKVRIFIFFPEFIKKWVTLMYISYRQVVESVYASMYNNLKTEIGNGLKIVYLTGFPRTGTTAMKYYFGANRRLDINPFDPAGFHVAWKKVRSLSTSRILVDKSNHYIKSTDLIFRACGEMAALCCIVRDPRDSLLSLLTFPEAREVPRGLKFWIYWYRNYNTFLEFAENSKYGSRIYFLRYEDFVTQPVMAKTDYLTWLGLDTSIEKIDNTYSVPETREFVYDKVHKQNTITADSLQRWKKVELPEKTLRLLQGWREYPCVADLMVQLGYVEGGLTDPTIRPQNFRMFRMRTKSNAVELR